MKISMRLISTMVATLVVATIVGCGGGDDHTQDYNPLIDDTTQEDKPSGGSETQPPATSDYNEQYRPQIHFTPAANWVNDPNGMVFKDGTYHLFYQYNPQGNDWGNMSCGHALQRTSFIGPNSPLHLPVMNWATFSQVLLWWIRIIQLALVQVLL